MKTKKAIIELLKSHQVATLGFKGLITDECVDEARKQQIDHIQKQLDDINNNPRNQAAGIVATMEVITEGRKQKIELNNGQFIFLPCYPAVGPLQVRSKDYIINGVYCQFADILPESFKQYGENNELCSFETKAGSVVVLCEN